MTAPMSLVLGFDIIGSCLMIILSLYAITLMGAVYRKHRGVSLYSYLYAQTIALAVFAGSRSLGHILKHLLITAGRSDIWAALSPVSGSINSITFVIFGLFALLYSNIRGTTAKVAALEAGKRKLKESETKLKRALERAEGEKAKTEAIIAGLGDGVSIQSRNYKVIYQNDVHKGFFGDHLGEYCYKAYESRGSICEGCPVELAFKDGGIHMAERTVIIGGETRHFEITASPIKDSTGEIVEAIEVARDVTERKKRDAFIKDILESVDEAFIVIDPKFNIISANRAFSDQSGMPLEEIINRPCYEVSHRQERPCYEMGEECPVKETLRTGEQRTAVHVHHEAEKSPNYVEVKSYPMKDSSGRIISVIEIINDITEKIKLEEQLRQSQKMEAIGTLTGGIAHDFNNILTAIIGYGEFLKSEIREAPLSGYVDMILASGERAALLTQSLLAFSRKQIIHRETVDLNAIIKNADILLSRLIGEDIELTTELSVTPLTIMADSVQIEQILINLATNARDAMPHGGSLIIKTGRTLMDDKYIEAHGYGKPGEYAVVSVTDTGTGMDEKTKEQIFEPFFTTKDVGKGTGLGLSVVYGLIKQHEGYINVYSEPGEGSTFRIYLPMVEARGRDEISISKPLHASVSGTETVLVAEDDPNVRNIIKSSLEKSGYKVLEAGDGEEAVTRFKENKDSIRLLVLDMVMPRENGLEAYERIRELRPGIKALFISGYPADIIRKKGIAYKDLNIISKPVSPTEMLKKVRETIDAGTNT